MIGDDWPKYSNSTAGGEAQLSLLHATWRWGWCQSGITHSYKNPAGCYLGHSRIVDGLLNPTKSWDNHYKRMLTRVDPTLSRFYRFGLGTIVLQFPCAWGTKRLLWKVLLFWCVKVCPKDFKFKEQWVEIPGGSFFFFRWISVKCGFSYGGTAYWGVHQLLVNVVWPTWC